MELFAEESAVTGVVNIQIKGQEQIPHKILRHLLIKEDDHVANCVIEFLGDEEGGKGCV